MKRGRELLVALAWTSCALPLMAQIEMGAPFADGVVLQRDRDVPAKDKFGKPIVGDYIAGPVLELRSEAVPQPVKVRYLGEPRTMGTVYNQAALPLGAFEMKEECLCVSQSDRNIFR